MIGPWATRESKRDKVMTWIEEIPARLLLEESAVEIVDSKAIKRANRSEKISRVRLSG